jgi:hypothetical protein
MSTLLENKTSLKVPYQLPEFIRSDSQYQTFVAFIQAYYEWMEQTDIGNSKLGAVYGSQKLANFNDIDYIEDGQSFNRFIDYYINDFLPNFPKDALTDKTKLLKLSKSLYATKGTPASYSFLFRALFDSDTEIFATRDSVLRASDGKWYVSKSLKLDSDDSNFLLTKNYRAFGETSKSIATIERALYSSGKIELFISSIERLFQSGETIRIIDNKNQTVYFKNGAVVPAGTSGATTITAKILGSISSVEINNRKRGQLYNGRTSTYLGDPVVFYGGLNSADGIGAKAYVNETTQGSIREVDVLTGGQGYRLDPNTIIKFSGTSGSGAIANVGAVDSANIANVTFVAKDALANLMQSFSLNDVYTFFPANTGADINCTFANAFTFDAFSTYPIADIIVNNGGGGYKTLPTTTAHSIYDTTAGLKSELSSLGILMPIRIINGGTGYSNGANIVFTGGSGYGANANVSVDGTGKIVSVQYNPIKNNNNVTLYPLGGMGYTSTSLPTLTVQGAGANASLIIDGIMGSGATLQSVPDERGIGAITSFVIENYGEDYIAAPKVSLRVRDIIVSNISPADIVKSGEVIYQGSSVNTAVFKAFVDSVQLFETASNEMDVKYLIRTYNYTSNTKTNMVLNVTDRAPLNNLYMNLANTINTIDADGNYIYQNGVRTYGNGAADATAKFLNGLIIGQGQYLKDDGFPSSFQILENAEYNDFTYQLAVEKSFDAYKDVLFKLLHPAGTKVLPVHTVKSHIDIEQHRETFSSNSHTLGYYTSDAGSTASMYGSFSAVSNNIIKFNDLVGSNIEQFMTVGAMLSINSNTGPNLYSQILSSNAVSNTVVVKDNVFLSFANVAYASCNVSNTQINISSITDQFDLVNNGEYSDVTNKMRDIVFNGDTIKLYSNSTQIYTGTVAFVHYANNTVIVTPAPSFTSSNTKVSISRNVRTNDVRIYNTLGTVFYPELTTENGASLTTEDGSILILG